MSQETRPKVVSQQLIDQRAIGYAEGQASVDRARLAQIAQEMRAAPVRPFSEGGHGGARVSLLVDAHAVHRWASAIEAAIGAKP